jgi:Holliday junction DNA helicase RuvA
MIGYLSGRLVRYRNGVALIVGESGGMGVFGYEVHCFLPSPTEGREHCMFIHHHQTEHGSTLYGFGDETTLDVFRELIKVQDVGPKAAALVLNAVGVKGVLRACAAKEPTQLAGVAKGVGPKTAARIVAELPESVIREFAPELLGAQKVAKAPASDVERDAESALRHMGYAQKEAREAIAATEDAERAELQRLLAASLKLLGRKKG